MYLVQLKLIPLLSQCIHVCYFVFSEEAENERMHLMTALQLKQPSTFFKLSVVGAQGKIYLLL